LNLHGKGEKCKKNKTNTDPNSTTNHNRTHSRKGPKQKELNKVP